MKPGSGFKIRLIYLLIFLYLFSILLFVVERSYYSERESLNRKFREFSSLAMEYRKIKEVKITDTGNIETVGLLQEINNLVDTIGLRERVKYIKMTGGREIKELIEGSSKNQTIFWPNSEEGAHIRIDKLVMNEMINLLYRIENKGLSIKDVRIKKDFENPDRIDLEIKVFMYKRG